MSLLSKLAKLNPFKKKPPNRVSIFDQIDFRSIFKNDPPSILDIDGRETENARVLNEMVRVQKERDFIAALHKHTRVILNLTNKIHKDNTLESLVELDNYVRKLGFDESFNDFLNAPNTQPQSKETT